MREMSDSSSCLVNMLSKVARRPERKKEGPILLLTSKFSHHFKQPPQPFEYGTSVREER